MTRFPRFSSSSRPVVAGGLDGGGGLDGDGGLDGAVGLDEVTADTNSRRGQGAQGGKDPGGTRND